MYSKRDFAIGLIFIISAIIFAIYVYLNSISLNILLAILFILLILTIAISLKFKLLSENYDRIIFTIFSFALILTAYLTLLLIDNKIPYYLNSLYILLGAIMVFSIDMLLNRKLDEEKDEKRKNRIIRVIMSMVKLNELNMNNNLKILEEGSLKTKLKPINLNFWDIFIQNILYTDIDDEFLNRLFFLKEVTPILNKGINCYNKYVDNIPADLDVSGFYDESTLKKIYDLSEDLKDGLNEFKNS